MNNRLPARFFLAASVALISGVAHAAPKPADQLVAIEAKWAKSMVDKDWATLDTIVAPDWTGQNPSGKLTNRATFLDDFKSGKNSVTAMTNHDLHVRIIGDVAIVQGMDDETSSYDGKDTSGSYSWTDIYQRRAGKWVAIASQVTPVAK